MSNHPKLALLLQHDTTACYAERCSKYCPKVRLSRAGTVKIVQATIDNAVFSEG